MGWLHQWERPAFFFLIVFQISIAKFVHEAAKTQLTGESKAAVEDDFKWAWDT